jgi:hypothetical protein
MDERFFPESETRRRGSGDHTPHRLVEWCVVVPRSGSQPSKISDGTELERVSSNDILSHS